MATTLEGDMIVRGTLRADSIQIPNNSVGDSQVTSTQPITSDKLEQQYVALLTQPHGTPAASERRVVHVAKEDGDLNYIQAGVVVANVGAATVTVDLLKNGVSILSSTVVLDSTNLAFTEEPGTFSALPYNSGDVFEVQVTAAAGGGTLAQGLYVQVVFREEA